MDLKELDIKPLGRSENPEDYVRFAMPVTAYMQHECVLVKGANKNCWVGRERCRTFDFVNDDGAEVQAFLVHKDFCELWTLNSDLEQDHIE